MFAAGQDDREKVELFMACRKLTNKDFLSKSDPFIKIYMGTNPKNMALIGQTEMIKDNLNPNFAKSVLVEYIFELKQNIRFEVFDYDSPTSAEYIGGVDTQVGAIVGAKNNTLIIDLHNKSSKFAGKLIVRSEKISACRDHITWQWNAVKLMNTDGWFDKSDPLLRFFKQRGQEWLKVHETEVVMNNLNPIWKNFNVRGDKLYGGDRSRPIRVECWDWEKSGNYQYIGDATFTMLDVINGKREYELHHPKKKKKTGTVKINTFSLQERPQFIDYIRGGEQLSVMTAIDFTGSNGVPTQPSSLHALRRDGSLNEYERAISSVCEILLNYDHDRSVPVFGFGGKPRFPTLNSVKTLHCFPCTGNPQQQEVLDLQGIMDVYRYALQHVELSGPTLFNPLIQEAMKVAQTNRQNGIPVYTILLILTDGEIHDMNETIESLIKAAYLPLSIIIVGVGSSDFGAMETLDGDDGLYNRAGQKAARDLVQFVPFRRFNGNQSVLAQNVLAEIPEQFVSYMTMLDKKPNPPIKVDFNTLMQPVQDNQHLMNAGMGLLQNNQLFGGMLPNQQTKPQVPPQNTQQNPPMNSNYIPEGQPTQNGGVQLSFTQNLQQQPDQGLYPNFPGNQQPQGIGQPGFNNQGYPTQQQPQINTQQGPFAAFGQWTQNTVNRFQ